MHKIFKDFFFISQLKIRVCELCDGENYVSEYGTRSLLFRAFYLSMLVFNITTIVFQK
jgi:hypothetical protein